jgi:hypothetical protein
LVGAFGTLKPASETMRVFYRDEALKTRSPDELPV